MNDDDTYPSQEVLNALVDGELAEEEQAEIHAAMAQNEKLRQKVCELRQLKELVQLSYPQTSEYYASYASPPKVRRFPHGRFAVPWHQSF